MKSLILKFMVLVLMVLTLSQFTNGLTDITRACEIALNRFERNKEMTESLWRLEISKICHFFDKSLNNIFLYNEGVAEQTVFKFWPLHVLYETIAQKFNGWE
jgi:hypothetical protein